MARPTKEQIEREAKRIEDRIDSEAIQVTEDGRVRKIILTALTPPKRRWFQL